MRKIVSLTAMLLLFFTMAIAQTRNINGRVVETNGDPVPFATIKVQGSKVTVAAGPDGAFVVKAKTGDVLEISAVNFTTQSVTVGAENNVLVKVTRTSTSLTDVVVTTGLGIQRQAKSLGYSTAKVTGNEIVAAKPISLANGLTGKVSGLEVSTVNNGLFAPTRITLRGNRSLTGNNTPLIVVDGAIYYADISTINPEDIGDITTLKGSSASAVYGSDASNGVIIVTTKHGLKGSAKTSVTVSSTIQAESISYMPDLQTRFGSNGGETTVIDFNNLSYYIPYENQSYGPEYNGKTVPVGRPLSDGSQLFLPYKYLPNAKRNFFNTGVTTQQNISLQSSEENGSFFLSAQDVVSTAVMPKDEGRRDIFRIGGSKRYGMFSANYALSYTYKRTNTSNTGAVYQEVIESPTFIDLTKLKNWQTDKYSTQDGYYNDYYANPWQTIDEYRSINTENDINGNLQLSLKPFKWLNLSYRASINNINTKNEFKGLQIVYSPFTLTNTVMVYPTADGSGTVSYATDPYGGGLKAIAQGDNPHPASYALSTSNNLLFGNDFVVSVNTPIAKNFNFNGTAGYSYLDNQIGNFNVGSNGSNALTFPVYNTSVYSNAPAVTGQSNYEARKLGLFGEATVDYKSLIYLHGSYRTDIDSRLSKDNRFIPYYDIDGSVVLSDLFKAITDNGVLNFAKLRLAHSLTGNVSPLAFGSQYIAYGAYATSPTLYAPSGFPYAASSLSGYANNPVIANPNIKPEKVTEDEIGLELGLFKDRLSINTSYYQSKTTDGIVYAQISRASGNVSALLNAAQTTNNGLEMDVKGVVVKAKDVTWSVGVNYTHNVSKVISISGSVPQLQLPGANPNAYAIVGNPYPVIQTFDWVRDPASGKVIVDAVTGEPSRSKKLTNFGASNPIDIIGVTTSVSWKGFTLSATADYRGGHKIFNVVGETLDHSGIGSTTALTGRQQFVFPNSVVLKDNKYVDNTSTVIDDANFNFWPTSYNGVGANYIVSAAAWKLREVVLTYNFPKSWITFTKVAKSAAFTVSGRNLLMIRPSTNKWTDPEFSEDAGNGVGRTGLGQAPPTRIFSGTLSITF